MPATTSILHRPRLRAGLLVAAVFCLLAGTFAPAQTEPTTGAFLRFRVLVVVYPNSFTSTISSYQLQQIQRDVATGQEFYWRNSRMQLHLAIDWITVPRLLTKDRFWELPANSQRYWLPGWTMNQKDSVDADLRQLNIPANYYDSVFVFYAWKNGPGHDSYAGGAATNVSSLLGKASYAAVPVCWTQYGNIFIHEFLHNVDFIYAASGFPEFPGPHNACNGGLSDDSDTVNGWILRNWPAAKYMGLKGNWGSYGTYVDADSDAFADLSPPTDALPITEATFGSFTTTADSDGDGLSDRDEATAAFRRGSDPHRGDTDGDGIRDGDDTKPLDAMAIVVPAATPKIDGVLAGDPYVAVGRVVAPNGHDYEATVYMAWDANYIYYAALHSDDQIRQWGTNPELSDGLSILLDLDRNGHVCGDANLTIYVAPGVAPSGPAMVKTRAYLRSTSQWIEDPLPVSSIKSAYTYVGSGWQMEVAIPRNTAIGIDPKPGFRYRTQITVNDFETINAPQPCERIPLFSCFHEQRLEGDTAAMSRGGGFSQRVGPVLTADRPVLGKPITLKLTGTPTPAAGMLLFSFEDPQHPIAPVTILGGRAFQDPLLLHVDVANPRNLGVIALVSPDPQGEWSLVMQLPAAPILAGVRFILQAAIAPFRGGLSASNGVTGVFAPAPGP